MSTMISVVIKERRLDRVRDAGFGDRFNRGAYVFHDPGEYNAWMSANRNLQKIGPALYDINDGTHVANVVEGINS